MNENSQNRKSPRDISGNRNTRNGKGGFNLSNQNNTVSGGTAMMNVTPK